jgi:hypothetical protein
MVSKGGVAVMLPMLPSFVALKLVRFQTSLPTMEAVHVCGHVTFHDNLVEEPGAIEIGVAVKLLIFGGGAGKNPTVSVRIS